MLCVTRLGDLLDFGKFLKPSATINLPKSPALLGNLLGKIDPFSSEIILGNFIDTWRFFSGHTASTTYVSLPSLHMQMAFK